MDSESILCRYKTACESGNFFRSAYETAYRMACPNHNNYDEGLNANKSYKVYTSLPTIATDGFVNTLMNTVTPIHTRFADIEAGPGIIIKVLQSGYNFQPSEKDYNKKSLELNKVLGDLTELLFNYLNASNLYSALEAMYRDACVGTGFLLAMPGDEKIGLGGPINFRAVSPKWMSIEEGAYGEISAVFRKISQKYRDAKIEWRDLKPIKDVDENQKIELIEATLFNYEDNRWEYYVLFNDQILLKRFYRSNPWIVFRWNVITGETWGRGPLLKALPDVMQLNATMQLYLRALQLTAYGCYTVISDDIINPDMVKIIPGGMIPVKRNAGQSGPSIQALPNVGNINAQMLNIKELEGRIQRILLDDNLPDLDNPKMTATEVLERVKKIQRDFGSVFGRISYELLQPILQRAIDILIFEKGLIPIPEELANSFSKIDGFNLKLKIVSPLARMQAVQDVESLIQLIQILGNINPELIGEQIKLNEIGEWVADKIGAPAKFLNSQEDIDAIKESKQQQMMQQMTLQQQLQGNPVS